MAMLPSVFRAEDNRGAGTDPIPAGWYKAEIVKSELKTTQKKDGKYLLFVHRIIDGEYEKRNIFTNVNVVNPNDIAVAIGKETLAAIGDAVEVEEFEDTVDLHGIEHWIKVVIKPAVGTWPEKNEIKAFKSLSAYDEMMDRLDSSNEDDDSPFN